MSEVDAGKKARIDALMQKVEADSLTPEEADELDELVGDAGE